MATAEPIKVYMAGKVGGLTPREILAWRLKLVEEIDRYGLNCICVSPVHDLDNDDIDKDIIVPACARNSVETQSDTIFKRDLYLIDQCQILFANFETGESIGTMFEIGYAYSRSKLVVTLDPNKMYIEHPFIRESSIYTTSWNDAMKLMHNLLSI